MKNSFVVDTIEIKGIPELHDRIIAGTALTKGLDLTTNDSIISCSKFISSQNLPTCLPEISNTSCPQVLP